MRRLMEPFLESFPWWCARPWLLALLLLFSPGAFLVGRYFQAKSAQSSLRQLEGYDQILNRARATAKALGIPAAEWRATFRFVPDAEMNRFAQRERAKIPAGVRRILPVESVRVLLLEGQGKWVEFSYTGEGHLLGYAPSPGIFVSDEMLANTGSRELALSALEAVVDPSAFEFGEASAKTSDGGMGQRFEWSLRAKCCPELATTAAVEVVGRRPSSLAIHTAFHSNYLFRRGTPLNLLVEVLRIGFLIVGLLFVGFRFAKRAMEHEVPYSRAGVMWGVWLMAGAIFMILQPFGGVEGETAFIAGPFWYVGIVLWVLIFAVTGMLLALAYGATEGDLRETFPGKLTSLEKQLEAFKQAPTLLKEEVDEEDIAQVVSRWTGIPLSKLLEGEVQKLLHLSSELHQRVVGVFFKFRLAADNHHVRVRVWPTGTRTRIVEPSGEHGAPSSFEDNLTPKLS